MNLHLDGTANRRTAEQRITAKDVICDPNFEAWFRSRSAHLA
jgi:hypothetical protein